MSRPAWIPVVGDVDATADGPTFRGEASEDGQAKAAIALTNQVFAGGVITVNVEFEDVSSNSVCDIVLWYDPSTRNMLTAGLGGGGWLSSVRFYNDVGITQNKWTVHKGVGNSKSLQPKRTYKLEAALSGSRVAVIVDGVVTMMVDTQLNLPASQVGLFFLGTATCRTSEFQVAKTRGQAFVVMEFGGAYDELYSDVIKPVCQTLDLDVHRADETYGPGFIIGDIAASIQNAKLIIAEITPQNANVFFEVGYAYAIRKPTILLAVEGTQLPFDVSPFRTLFYENTIGGRKKVEEGLRQHVNAALQTGQNLGTPP